MKRKVAMSKTTEGDKIIRENKLISTRRDSSKYEDQIKKIQQKKIQIEKVKGSIT